MAIRIQGRFDSEWQRSVVLPVAGVKAGQYWKRLIPEGFCDDMVNVIEGAAIFKIPQHHPGQVFKTTSQFHVRQHPVNSVRRLRPIF